MIKNNEEFKKKIMFNYLKINVPIKSSKSLKVYQSFFKSGL